MIKAPLFSKEGDKIGEYELPEKLFGLEPNPHLLWEVVRMYHARKRKGTHHAKSRGEIEKSKAKIWPQKGLGRARHGDRYAPIFVGGAKAHGPKERDYSYELPKKAVRLALLHSLSDRASEGKIYIFEEFNLTNPKTKEVVALLEKIGLREKKVLFLTQGINRNLYLSGRNIPKVEVLRASDVNAMHVLNSEYIVIEKAGISQLEKRALK